MSDAFPFDAVVGQDDAKLALRLAAVDPLIGGVLLRGQKGSAKTTLARGLAALSPDAPFVELPLGATEDRVVGTIDTRAAVTGGEILFEPGLLAAADGGVLYVDEINLLPDHLVDVLLDVAVSGENVVERDGVSHRHPSRFVLVGSMNPEEGELRPQLLDRFGLCVEVRAPVDVADRIEAVRRRLAHDAGTPSDQEVSDTSWSPSGSAEIGDEIMEAASRLALRVGAEGLRADLTLCRAAAAVASLDGRAVVDVADVRRVAPLVLAHRSRRGPFDPPVLPPDQLDDAIDQVLPPPPRDEDVTAEPEAGSSDPGDGTGDHGDDPRAPAADRPVTVGAPRRPPLPLPDLVTGGRGRSVGDEPADGRGPVAVVPSVRAAARRRRHDRDATIGDGDLRQAIRARPRSRTIVMCVDLSGSMGADDRAGAATGAVFGLLAQAYEQRHTVGLVTFRGDGAEVALTPTRSIEVARNRLDHLTTGGATPLAAGLDTALGVAVRSLDDSSDAVVAVLTDGRATGTSGGMDATLEAAARIRATRAVAAVVLDCETGARRLGLAADLAEAMGARHVPVTDLAPAAITGALAAGLQ